MLIYLRLFLIIRSSISSSCWCAAVLISHCNLRLVSNLIFFFLLQRYLGNPEKKWKTSIPVTPAVCSHRIFYLKQAGTMTETTDCQEQRLTVVLLQYSIPSNQWFIQLLPRALFLLVHFLYNLITSQRNPLMLMEHLLYQNCLHPHLPSLHRKQREKVCLLKFPLVFKIMHCITVLVQSTLVLEFKDIFLVWSYVLRTRLLFRCVYFPLNHICYILYNFKLTRWYLLFTGLFCKLTFQMIIWKMYFSRTYSNFCLLSCCSGSLPFIWVVM